MSDVSDSFEVYLQANLIKLGKTIVEFFEKCKTEKNDCNSRIMVLVYQEIEKQSENFREFIEASIESSNHLEDFSIDILFFAECFEQKEYPDEDILELLGYLLEKSKRNYESVKELKKMISNEPVREEENFSDPEFMVRLESILAENIGLKEKLTNINNFLNEHIEDIANSDRKSILNRILQSLQDPVFALAALFSAEVWLLYTIFAVCNEINTMNKRNILIKKVKHISDDIGSIISEIGKLEVFWIAQIEGIESLKTKFREFNGANKRIQRHLVVNNIKKKWEDIRRQCKIYSKVMKDLLITIRNEN